MEVNELIKTQLLHFEVKGYYYEPYWHNELKMQAWRRIYNYGK